MASGRDGRRPRIDFDRRILLLGLAAGLPGTALALLLLWTGDFSLRTQWTLTALLVTAWLWIVFRLREGVIRPLQTLSNMMAALLEGDYSIRPRERRATDSLGLAFREIGALGQTLREQRLGAFEATALLRKVMDEVDAAFFVFDPAGRLRLVNRAAARLLREPVEKLLGSAAADLGLEEALAEDAPRTLEKSFPGGSGRWEVRTAKFLQGGVPHRLLMLNDIGRALREEERQAWQRLVRVLGHEINNSLTPIMSIAASLRDRFRHDGASVSPEKLEHGLDVIAGRAESLRRFMTAHARLARLPSPRPGPVEVEAWVRRVVALETRRAVDVVPGPRATLRADADQLDQLLINLVKNAVDAASETGGAVRVRWLLDRDAVQVEVEDEGPGVASTANLFVPFFTTKPNGSGIGLPLSRQIAESHGGSLVLENRSNRAGSVARLRLPLNGSPPPRP